MRLCGSTSTTMLVRGILISCACFNIVRSSPFMRSRDGPFNTK